MSQQSRIDSFFPTIKGSNGNSNVQSGKILGKPNKSNKKRTSNKFIKSPKKMSLSQDVKRRNSLSEEQQIRKIPKIGSPLSKVVKIYPTAEEILYHNGNSPQKSYSCTLLESPEKPKIGSFSPKKSPRSMSGSRHTRNFSPKKLFGEAEVPESTRIAIDNINMLKQGAVGPNDFDLETIYKSGTYEMQYNSLNTNLVNKYEVKDVIFPKETHGDSLFNTVMDVFSNIVNCGYFNEKEIDFVFSCLSMSAKAQMLLARLLKRKRSWHRISAIQYPEIDKNLDSCFRELITKEFCVSKTEEEEIGKLLKMLKVDEMRTLCLKLKVDHRGSKTVMMEKLLLLNSKQKSWFVGAKSPSSALRSSMNEVLGPCVRLSKEAISIFDRIFVLLFPCQDPSESISDLFLLLMRVKTGEIMFPTTPKERFPIFKNRDQLLRYVDAQNALKKLIESVENKEWESVRKIGNLAYDHLFPHMEEEEEDSSLPSHVKKFCPLSIWTKVLSKSIDAFKKTPETMEDAVKYLRALINQNKYGKTYLGRWYRELSLIEMHHRKDLETSASLTLNALSQESLSEVDVKELIERAKKLVRRKNGITENTKATINDVLEKIERELPGEFDVVNEIEAIMVQGNMTGSKSTWTLQIGEDKGYTKVENVALRHYHENGFSRGFHCEGSLPLSLFTIMFWSELYSISVPGAFVCSYQEAPLDLFTSKFFDNRKEQIEDKIKFIRALDDETLGEFFSDEFMKYRDFKSTIVDNLFETEQHVKEVTMSLGTNGVAGICERVANNFRLWRSGFPDLFVWNPFSFECKIVEVKGPGDTLSSKQKLWLQYLQQIGLRAEVCIVKDKRKSGKM